MAEKRPQWESEVWPRCKNCGQFESEHEWNGKYYENGKHYCYCPPRAAASVVGQWACACGWRGTSAQMTVSNEIRTCPNCGGSGGLVLAQSVSLEGKE